MKILPRWVPWIILPLAGAGLFYVLSPGYDPVIYREVIVPAARILEQEPDTVVKWRERIVTVEVQPEQIATAPLGGMNDLAAFCAPSMLPLPVPPPGPSVVTEAVRDTASAGRSVVHSDGWFWFKDDLTVTAFTNYGDLRAEHYRVRDGFSVRFGPTPSTVRSPRFGLVKEFLEVIIPFAAGRGSCKVF